MTDVTVWHNPRCSKSRATLSLLEEKGYTLDIVHYLKDPPTIAILKEVINKMGGPVARLIRTGEAMFKTLKLDGAGDDALFAAMAKHPGLIERPVVICGTQAAIGRPPESVLAILPKP